VKIFVLLLSLTLLSACADGREIMTDLAGFTENVTARPAEDDGLAFKRGETAVFTFKGKANVLYSVKVIYTSAPSTAKGLEDKFSDENGVVTWEWKISSRTAAGNGRHIIVNGNGETYVYLFSVY